MLSAQEIDFVDEIWKLNSIRITENPESVDENLWEKLKDSQLISNYNNVYFYKSFQIKNSTDISTLVVLKNSYSVRNGKYDIGDYELQLIGVKKLSQSFGNIFIRPETFEDKINEFFEPTEIDFKDYTSFSSRYYLQAENEILCHSFATDKRIKLIESQMEIVIHVMNDLFIAKYCRRLTHNDFEKMISFIKEI